MDFFNKFLLFKSLYYICALINHLRQVEPPNPILNEQRVSADQKSEDPLSNSVFMVMGSTSDEGQEACYVCAWSARTGLSYIGTPGTTVS